jgi:hypothetical protein
MAPTKGEITGELERLKDEITTICQRNDIERESKRTLEIIDNIENMVINLEFDPKNKPFFGMQTRGEVQ